MQTPRVSVVVCVRNRPQQIGHCLSGLLESEYPNFEVVVVDDASTDKTPAMLADYCRRRADRPIKIVTLLLWSGVSGARNAGVRAATGEIVLFIDSDCQVDRTWMRFMASALAGRDRAAATGPVADPPPSTWAERAYAGTSRIDPQARRGRKLSGGNMGFSRQVLIEHPFDEALRYGCDEDDLAVRLKAAGVSILFVPTAPVRHDHPLTLDGYLRQGVRQGEGAARFWYKHGVYVGRDLLGMTAGAVGLVLAMVRSDFLVVSGVLFAFQFAAIVYNERTLKGKTWKETLIVLPVCLLYYVCKFGGMLCVYGRLICGGEAGIRRSKRRFGAERKLNAAPTH